MLKGKSKVLQGGLLPAAILAIWLLGSYIGAWNRFLIPSPHDVISACGQLLGSGELTRHVSVSLGRVVAGFAMAFLLAFPLAALLGMQRQYYNWAWPTLEFVRHIPPLAAIPMLILWFGIGEAPKLIVVLLATFFPIFLNTLHGIMQCDERLIEVGKSFRLSSWIIFRRIILPAALPSILVGMRLGLGYSWRAIIGAELIAASSGIGYMILDAEQLSRPDVVVLGMLIIGIVGSIVDWLFFRLAKNYTPWKESESMENAKY